MSDLTPEALDDLAGLLEAATDGPWEVRDGYDPTLVSATSNWPEGGDDALGQVYGRADAALIVALRNHAPALIATARERDAYVDLYRLTRRRFLADARAERDAARAEVAALRERVEAVAADFDTAVGFRGAATAVRAALAEAAPDQASERSGYPQTVPLVGDHRPVWEKQRDGDSERSGE